VEQAPVALPGDRILGLGEIKNYGAVFNDYGIARAKEKVFDGANQGLWRHGWIVSSDLLSSL
jgi:hypothetical protein